MKFVKMEKSVIETPAARDFAETISADISPVPCDGVAALEPTKVYCFRNGAWVLDRTDC